ncbi:MAG: hypothetical protein V1854_01835 [Methanobacteriota archaeon]
MADRRTEAEKHIRRGHTVIVHVVGSNELTTCQTCKITLRSKKIDVS